MGELLQEVGVLYSSKPSPGLKEFSYMLSRDEFKTWSVDSVWCFNREDFEKLLKHWNRDKRWQYVEDEEL